MDLLLLVVLAHPTPPDLYLYTDAILEGWGAPLEPGRLSCHGFWDHPVFLPHVNNLELLAVQLELLQVGLRAHCRTVLHS